MELEELKKIVYEKHGISKETVVTYNGYSLKVDDYLMAVTERGGANRIIPFLKTLPSTPGTMEMFLQGAIHRIIGETIKKNKDFYGYYKNKIREVK